MILQKSQFSNDFQPMSKIRKMIDVYKSEAF